MYLTLLLCFEFIFCFDKGRFLRGGEGWNLRIIKWQKIILQRGSLASYLLSVHFRGKEVQNNVDGNKK